MTHLHPADQSHTRYSYSSQPLRPGGTRLDDQMTITATTIADGREHHEQITVPRWLCTTIAGTQEEAA